MSCKKAFFVKENGEDERVGVGLKVGKIHQHVRGGFFHMFFKVYPKTLGR